ncbi:2-succinyl-6-hydroxy-2,4-cyclohexadiene-1-carboxylate synthase [Metasolibacillus meyeri]|uniref:2-succinyl-6-hydroxy-2, 4-cyclohexadiene-1-carboxylate synthase n=1 Tax=Metasolibacillus meyeri TaxID=1071052 RepID=UPI000D31B589|nr:2-succinyl-6-hydroxy-2,4-cyclohexadiene-1-carboxylate synthase [Metasolibacillus meyeri]
MVTEINGINVHVRSWNDHLSPTLVCLHGFTGSANTWQPLANEVPVRLVAIDLMGHGATDAPDDVVYYTMDAQLEILDKLFKQLGLHSFILLGYSLGGRVALSYAVHYPKKIQHLILESASPGLEKTEERLTRQEADNQLAQSIEQNGLKAFVEKWETIPLFASQKQLPKAVQQTLREERLQQREIGLANSLRGIGTGVMPPLWNRLHQLKMPVTLITGQLDTKFVAIAESMRERIQQVEHRTINGVGHAIHVENLAEFATIVKEVFQEI